MNVMIDPHNSLRLALRALTEAVCQRLAGQPIPMATVHVMRYTADGSGRGEPRMTAAPAGLVAIVQQEWQLWSAFETLRAAIQDDPVAANYLYSDAVGNPLKGNEQWIVTMIAARFTSTRPSISVRRQGGRTAAGSIGGRNRSGQATNDCLSSARRGRQVVSGGIRAGISVTPDFSGLPA